MQKEQKSRLPLPQQALQPGYPGRFLQSHITLRK